MVEKIVTDRLSKLHPDSQTLNVWDRYGKFDLTQFLKENELELEKVEKLNYVKFSEVSKDSRPDPEKGYLEGPLLFDDEEVLPDEIMNDTGYADLRVFEEVFELGDFGRNLWIRWLTNGSF